MFIHFLLRSPVILLFLRYLIFQKTNVSMLVPIWDPLGPQTKSIDHFWHPLGSALAPDRAPGTSLGAALAAEHAPGTRELPETARNEN